MIDALLIVFMISVSINRNSRTDSVLNKYIKQNIESEAS